MCVCVFVCVCMCLFPVHLFGRRALQLTVSSITVKPQCVHVGSPQKSNTWSRGQTPTRGLEALWAGHARMASPSLWTVLSGALCSPRGLICNLSFCSETVKVSQLLFQKRVRVNDHIPIVLPHINLYLSRRWVRHMGSYSLIPQSKRLVHERPRVCVQNWHKLSKNHFISTGLLSFPFPGCANPCSQQCWITPTLHFANSVDDDCFY